MKQIFLTIFLSTVSIGVQAADGVYACQYSEAAGLDWQGGRWQSTLYNRRTPFFLKIEAQGLLLNSVATALEVSGIGLGCFKDSVGVFSCTTGTDEAFSSLGSFLIFDPKRARGGVAEMLGSLSTQNRRDSLAVMPFVCQRM